MKRIDKLSVFFPAYNEEANIEKTVTSAIKILPQVAKIWEVIVVDDGSKDRTCEIVKNLAKKNKNIRLIIHEENKGYGAAIKTGLYNVRFPWVVQMDSDGQFDFLEIKKFLAKIKEADLIIGYRIRRTDSLYRRFMAKVLWLADFILFGLKVKDIDCGFKLFKKKIIEKIPKLETESAITVTEFIVKAKKVGVRIAQVGVHHYSRKEGEQTGGKPSIIIKAAFEGIFLWLTFLKKGITSNGKRKIFEIILLFLILIIAAFLRLYKIRDYIVFLGDQGRDVLVVKRMIVDKKFTLLGPTASVGGFYLGPIYYYMMIIPLWLSNLDPVGPAIMVALFGASTVFLVYQFSKELFNSFTAAAVSLLYAISPLTVRLSRFSWNPNTLPFFSLIFIYFLYQSFKKRELIYSFFAGIAFGIAIQLHYLALILGPIGFFMTIFLLKKNAWVKNLFMIVLGWVFGFFPFLFFEVKHGFPNFRTIWEFVTRKGGAVTASNLNFIANFFNLTSRLFEEFLNFSFIYSPQLKFFLITIFLLLVFQLFKNKGKNFLVNFILIWWLSAIGIFSLYRGTIYDYYFCFLFPLAPIILGFFLHCFFNLGKKIGILVAFLLVLIVLPSQIKSQPIFNPPNKIVDQTERIADLVIKATAGKPFNFALLSQGNSDHAYRYFLEIKGYKPVDLEQKITEQLIIVCEERECAPLGHPLWEIAAFGRAEIDKILEDPIKIKVIRLIHHPDSMDLIGKPAKKGG